VPLSFDDLVDPFEQGRGLPPHALRTFAALVRALTGDHVHPRVVEPGIGPGRLALPLLLGGCHVTGVDISQPMLDRLAARSHGLPGRCDLVRASATALPFPAATFELGYVASLFYLIPDWQWALYELARVVRPGGSVLFCRERSDLSPALTRFDAAWRELISATGFRHEATGPDDETVIRTMNERIGPVERRSLAQWTIGQTVAEGLDGYDERLRPLYAGIPEPTWTRTVGALVARARELFPDSTTRLDCQVSFEVAIARVS
jgi:SAM-dependent methyltransferase